MEYIYKYRDTRLSSIILFCSVLASFKLLIHILYNYWLFLLISTDILIRDQFVLMLA